MKPSHSSRGHSVLPPSSADKWLNCWGWKETVRQHQTQYGRSGSSPEAEEGTRAHERLETLIQTGPLLEGVDHGYDEEFDEELLPMLEWILDHPGDTYSEIRIDFGENMNIEGMTGTLDLAFVQPHKITIADLKYGRGVVEVERNRQLMVYLLGAVNQFGPREEYEIVILQPRAWHRDGPIRSYSPTPFELLVFETEVEDAIQGNLRGGECTAGDWCRKFCEAQSSCRTLKRAALKRFKEEPIDD